VSRITADVAIVDIDIPKSRNRKIDWTKEEHARFLSSFRRDGQQVPILVQPGDGKSDKKYRLVFGTKRTRAAMQLDWTTIRAEIDDEMTDEEAEAALLAENLFRQGPASGHAFRVALRQWWELHEKRQEGKNDLQVHAGSRERDAGGMLRGKKPVAQPAQSASTNSLTMRLLVNDNEEVAEEPAPVQPSCEEPQSREKPFAKQIQELTGCSRAESFRDAAVARAFTTEQLEALEQEGYGQEKYLKMIVALNQPDDIVGALNLVACGHTPEEAVAHMRKMAAEGRIDPEDDPLKMSDEKWLVTQCCACRDRLPNKAAFDQAALNYRKTVGALKILKGHVGKLVKVTERGRRYDPFTAMISRVIHVKHPDEWSLCAICGGTGQNPEQTDQWCDKCRGAGFFVECEKKEK
jgi:hypothetical protein